MSAGDLIPASPNRPELPLWRNRDFVILRSGRAVSGLGSQMTRVAMPLLVLDLTRSPALTGLVGLIGSAPALLLGLPLGALVDRWDRRAVMLISTAGLALTTASVAFALLLGGLTIIHLVIAGLVASTCGAAFGMAESAAIPSLVPPAQLSSALAQNEAAVRTTQLIGPPIGGTLFGIARALPFLADAISFAVLLLALLPLRLPPGMPGRTNRTGLWSDVGEGVSWVWHQPFIRTTLLLTAGGNLLLTAVSLLVIVVARNGGASPGAIGLIFTAEAVFAIASTALAPYLSRRLTLGQTVIGSHWLWVGLFPLYLVSHDIVVLAIVTGAAFCLSPIRNVILISYQLRIIPDELRGRVGSVAGLITGGPMPFGSAVCGLLLQQTGAGQTTLALTMGAFLLALAASTSSAIRHGP